MITLMPRESKEKLRRIMEMQSKKAKMMATILPNQINPKVELMLREESEKAKHLTRHSKRRADARS